MFGSRLVEQHVNKKILTTGADRALLSSRASILDRKYEAKVVDPRNALAELHQEDYDLLLVCYSIPADEASRLIAAAHEEFPELCIVRLLSQSSPLPQHPIAHRTVTVDFTPTVWMNAVDELLAPGTVAAFQ